jgi:hypothetical protein
MAVTTGPNLGLKFGYDPGAAGWGVDSYNPALALLDAVVQLAVLSAALTAPPGTPAEGDRYIVAAGATGAWAGRDNQVAVYRAGAWAFYLPAVGWLARVLSPAGLVSWTGAAWVSAAPVDAAALAAAQAAETTANNALAAAQQALADVQAAIDAAGAGTFLGLTDAPDAYAGAEGHAVAVKADATGVAFVPFPAGTVGGLTDGPGAPAGDAYRLVRVRADAAALEYVDWRWEASVAVNGKPSAGEALVRHVFTDPVRIAANLAGWRLAAGAAATAGATFTAYRNGVSIGTMTVGAGAAAATGGVSAETDFAAGDLLTFLAPGVVDATLADFGISFTGTRR